jgi:arginine/lysine/ornithine decarboxylase
MGCPPAILPVVPGEKIDRGVIEILTYYGKQEITVLK